MQWSIELYELSNGCKPVLEFIDDLPAKDKVKIIKELNYLRTMVLNRDPEGLEDKGSKICGAAGIKSQAGFKQL